LIEKRKGRKMKITNCLRILLTMVFVLGVLITSHVGRAGVVAFPDAGGSKVKTGESKVAPTKMVPKEEEKKVVPTPKKEMDLGKQAQKSTLPADGQKPKQQMRQARKITLPGSDVGMEKADGEERPSPVLADNEKSRRGLVPTSDERKGIDPEPFVPLPKELGPEGLQPATQSAVLTKQLKPITL
jgi:hypothetical protein